MRRVTWQAMASAEEAAAADGPFSSVQATAATDSRQLSARVTADPAELTPVQSYMSGAGGTIPEESAAANSRFGPGPCAEGAEGQRVSFDSSPPRSGPSLVTQFESSWAAASRNNSTSGGNSHINTASPASSTAKWTISSRRHRTTHGTRTLGPGGNTAARRAAGGSGSAAAAAADSSWMDPHVGFDLMQNLGLAGGFAGRLALLGAILLHGVLLAVRAQHSVGMLEAVEKKMLWDAFCNQMHAAAAVSKQSCLLGIVCCFRHVHNYMLLLPLLRRVLPLCCMQPRALHDSSWGRWVKRMVFEVFFVVVFQVRPMRGTLMPCSSAYSTEGAMKCFACATVSTPCGTLNCAGSHLALQMTVMAEWHGSDQWQSQQLLLFALPALLLGNILDIMYQLK